MPLSQFQDGVLDLPVWFFSKEHFKIQICNIFANRIDPAHIFANILLNFF